MHCLLPLNYTFIIQAVLWKTKESYRTKYIQKEVNLLETYFSAANLCNIRLHEVQTYLSVSKAEQVQSLQTHRPTSSDSGPQCYHTITVGKLGHGGEQEPRNIWTVEGIKVTPCHCLSRVVSIISSTIILLTLF